MRDSVCVCAGVIDHNYRGNVGVILFCTGAGVIDQDYRGNVGVILFCAGAGVIDQDYRGNVGVILFNFGNEPFTVKRGDRIAQLILERIFRPSLVELPSLDVTERGDGGFGSTGKH